MIEESGFRRRTSAIPESTTELEDSMDFLLAWSISVIGVVAAAKILPGAQVPSAWDAVVVAAVFGVLNFFLGWLVFCMVGVLTLAAVVSSGIRHAGICERICLKAHRRCGALYGNCHDGQRRTCGADYPCGRRTGEYVDTLMRKSHSERPASASSGVA